MSITEDQFRKTLGLFPTGVTVVTTPYRQEDIGITISSFTSVSLNPPQILFCLSKYSRTTSIFKECVYFSINILSAHQSHISDIFAKHMPWTNEALKGVRHEGTGCLLFSDALGYIVCEKGNIYEEGDHHIILGHVIAVGNNLKDPPLVRQRGQYLTTQSISPVEPFQKVCSL